MYPKPTGGPRSVKAFGVESGMFKMIRPTGYMCELNAWGRWGSKLHMGATGRKDGV